MKSLRHSNRRTFPLWSAALAAASLISLIGASGTKASSDELPPPPSLTECPPAVKLAALLPPATVPPVPETNEELGAVLNALGETTSSPAAPATLESSLTDQLRQQLPDEGKGYVFDRIRIPETKLPKGDWSVSYDFRLPDRGVGETSFTGVLTNTRTGQQQRLSGSLTVDREAEGLQVTRMVRRSETLTAKDVKSYTTRLSQLPRGALDGNTTFDSAVTRRELRPGMWLTEDMLKVPEVVRRGQTVRMILDNGTIHITAPGVARQGGAIGDLIKVDNADTGRALSARILSQEEVQVVH